MTIRWVRPEQRVWERMMRFCGSFQVVEFMRAGNSPEMACRMAIERIAKTAQMPIEKIDINFVAVNKSGEYGAAGTSKGFRYSYATSDQANVLDAFAMTNQEIGPEGGNIR
ncbi:MAG: isoaspartyl peptidase/L-asparaginase [Pirellulaceae bacterium]